jgi:Calx-beta domain
MGLALILIGCGASMGCVDEGTSTQSSTPVSPTSSTTSAGVLSLSASSYNTAQNAGSVTVSVNRTGGSSGAASVTYVTEFGTALGGINYDDTQGVLTWASGDATAKSFTIPILNATPFSGTRSLSVALSTPTGASIGGSAAATITIEGDAGVSAQPPATAKQSISAWVSCTGTSDDTAGVRQAFAAASQAAFTLVVDCPVRIHVGTDITRPIFIDDGTTVEFTGAGKFTIDNVFIPAFVIANSSNITLTDWNVEYDASMPVNQKVGGYESNGHFIQGPLPGNAFNDLTLTHWLAAHRAIVFDPQQGVNAAWSGTTNACAVFFISGDSANVSVTGMQMYVPAAAGGDRFIPVVFALAPNYKSNQTLNANIPLTAQYFAVPHELTFSNVTLDGTYMGWVGGARNAVFQNIQSHRYGDLQDANGENVGGVGKWFAPPHLFYLSYSVEGDPGLYNSNIRIENVADDGPRIGTARDKGGTDSISGYALSLKIGCVACSVNTYRSSRPDGFLDVLPSNGLTISNAAATYDSSFLNNLYPGWRFPSQPYKNVTFTNIALTDTAASTVQLPIGNAGQGGNQALTFTGVQVGISRWSGANAWPLPTIAGQGNDVSLNYQIADSKALIVRQQTDTVSSTLEATPSTLTVGATTRLLWTSENAQGCSATGAWSGPLPTVGSRRVTVTATGNYGFSIACANGANASNSTAHVVAN